MLCLRNMLKAATYFGSCHVSMMGEEGRHCEVVQRQHLTWWEL